MPNLWIAGVIFVVCIGSLAWLRGWRSAAITAVLLLVVGAAYVFLVGESPEAGKWILATLILIVGLSAHFVTRGRRDDD